MRKNLGVALCVTALCVAMTFIVSCTKKNDRLVSDTLVISISPQTLYLSTGTAKSLTATCKSAASSNANVLPTWTVDSPTLGTFNPTQGKTTTFTATSVTSAVGTGKIYATFSNIKASASIVVATGAVLGSITISPTSVSVSTGGTQALTATCKDTTGAVLNILPQWTVTPASLGTVSPTQGNNVTFTAASQASYAGSGSIKASFGGISGSSSLAVSSAAVNSSIYGLYPTVYTGDGYTHLDFGSLNPSDPNGGTLAEVAGATYSINPSGGLGGTQALVCVSGGGNGQWWVQLGNNGNSNGYNGTSDGTDMTYKNMSAFNAGYLKFDIQCSVATMWVKIFIETGNDNSSRTQYVHVYFPPDTNWNSVEIPLYITGTGTAFEYNSGPGSVGSIDFTHMLIPAEFYPFNSGSAFTVSVDNVRWYMNP